jgi:hypothetical protein
MSRRSGDQETRACGRNRNVRHEQEEATLKFMLHSFVVIALAVLAADVCGAATAGPNNKKVAAAIWAARPQQLRGGRLNAAPRNGAAVAARNAPSVNATAITPHGFNAFHASAARKGSVANLEPAARQAIGSGPASPSGPAGQPGSPRQPGSATSGAQRPASAAHDAVVSGTGIKHSTSALAALGGATTGKGAAVINGTSMRPKQH